MILYVKFFNQWSLLAAAKIPKNLEPLRAAVLNWIGDWVGQEIEPAEIADGAMQMLSSHNGYCTSSLEYVEKIIAKEVEFWKNKKSSEIETAINSLISLSSWLLVKRIKDREKKLLEWMGHEYGFQWWVGMDILSKERKAVILAALESGEIPEKCIEKISNDFKFSKKDNITKDYSKTWRFENGVAWPEDWRSSWEAGGLKKKTSKLVIKK